MPHLSSHFILRPDITYLNFGSYGACVRPVFENYQQWQKELEMEPCQFMNVTGPEYLRQSRAALADYIHCDADDLVYVTNPSYAANIVAKSFPLQPGDEVLSTNLEYGACDRTWNYYCKKAGARFVRHQAVFPLVSKEQFVQDFVKGINEKTRLIFISQITSVTGLILPVAEICAIGRQRGIMVFIDGAHVPGHLPLDISQLQPDFYTGACHKWMLTPKGSSFLYVRKALQSLLDPLVISWGYESEFPSESRFLDYHQLQGTRDFSAFLTVPEAIRFMKEYDWESVAECCKQLVRTNAMRFCDLVGSKPIVPVTEDFIGQMFSIPIKTKEPRLLQNLLFERYRIEVPVMVQNGNAYLRYSINAFNSQDDLDKLFDALRENLSMLGLSGKN
jgi:isopenicillin-N epimerase